jgi:sugar lactone lactonase YvrE
LLGSVPGAAFEGAIVDPQGHLYATDLLTGRVYRFDHPGATPTVLTTVPGGIGAGALAFEPDGDLLIGYGSDPRVLAGDIFRSGRIERMNLTTGAITQVASGLSAADGLAVAADGTIYATNDFGTLIARISPDGTVDPDWAHFPSANGAVLSANGQYLYVSRTFYNPGVSRIPVDDPSAPQSLITLSGPSSFEALDGLTLDSPGRAIVPTDLGGEILRVAGVGQVCELSSAPLVSSVITYGHGSTGFSAGRLFRAGFDGDIYEIPAGFDPGGS